MSTIAVPVPTAAFLRLASFLKETRPDQDPVSVVEDAIDYWIDSASWKPELGGRGGSPGNRARGYMWKQLFLTSGTVLRIRNKGEYQYARVEGDHLIYCGKRVSPNQFALTATGSARDAWRDVWVKRPNDGDYILADTLR